MKTINIATANGYIFVNGKLTAYHFNSAVIDFAEGIVKYNCVLGGEETSFETKECPVVYKDENAYQIGKAEDSRVASLYDAICSSFFYISKTADLTAYCIVDNEVKERPFPESSYLFNGYRYSHPNKGSFYESYEKAMLCCDIVKVDENGKETIIPSVASRIALDDEQTQAIKVLTEAFKRVKELDIEIVSDYTDDTIYAFSNRNIKGYEYDCCCTNVICGEGYLINHLMTDIEVGVISLNREDTQMFAKFN